MKLTTTIPILCPLALVASCSGTEVGNPSTDSNMDFALYNTPAASLREASTLAGEGAIIQAWVAVERVRLRSAADCSGGAEAELAGPIAVDLLRPGSAPELVGFALPATDYCRIEIKWNAFSSGLPARAPTELTDASFFLEGTREDGTPFVLRSRRNDELRLEAIGGAFAVADDSGTLFVGMDSALLLAGVNLAGADVNADGTIYIDDNANRDLLEAFEASLEAATRLYEDSDGNGLLDSEEREDSDALAD